jgi:hypothetical protein
MAVPLADFYGLLDAVADGLTDGEVRGAGASGVRFARCDRTSASDTDYLFDCDTARSR